EDSQNTGKVTSAGMYTCISSWQWPKIMRLPSLKDWKVMFSKPASYMIEAMCAKSYEDTTEWLKEIESKILAKRNDLCQFETEYRKVDDMLWERDNIHCSFTTEQNLVNPVGAGSSSLVIGTGRETSCISTRSRATRRHAHL
ncbi:hypothetical protein BAE44_0004000, partial [Dichanthelium oligosanthes]